MQTGSAAAFRVVLIEDHLILREGLVALLSLESDIRIVGAFGSVEEGIASVRGLQPDVLVTDLRLPGGSGVDLIRAARELTPLSRILVLTADDSQNSIREALTAGARGYVLKDAGRGELLAGLRSVHAGEPFFCKTVAGKVVTGYLNNGNARPQPTLSVAITAREREVLTRIAHGHSNKVIARELGVSPKTVDKHRSNLMRKLQLHNAAAITMFAIQHGLADSQFRPAV